MYRPGRGLGAASCNWVDDFGECITGLLPGDRIVAPNSAVSVTVTPSGTKYFNAAGQDITATLKTAGGAGFSDFVNKNATTIGIAAAAFFGIMLLSRR